MALDLTTQYPGKTAGATANYPFGEPRNITVSGDGTGTPWEAAIVKDLVGVLQATLTEAGVTPSGTPDTALASQYLEAMRTVFNARSLTHNMATDADYTLLAAENKYLRFIITDTTPVLTTARNIIVLNTFQRRFLVKNNTLQSLTFKTSAGTGVSVAAGQTADLLCDGTNVISATPTQSVSLAQNFRITLTTGVPVTTSDVLAATTLYFTPYNGNQIALYNGTSWDVVTSAQISIAVPATTSQMYDVFVYNNAGVATLELTAWTNDTTRATALTYQDGVLVKSGALTRRYVGSFRTTTVSGQTEDSVAKRYVWNYYNRSRRLMFKTETTASWTYKTAADRQVNANAANQLDFIIGVSEDTIKANASLAVTNSSTTGVMLCGIGLDSTTVNSATITTNGSTAGTTMAGSPSASFEAFVAVGRHFLAWLEYSTAVGTSTWATNVTPVGIKGEILG